jgi:hypothetical protein
MSEKLNACPFCGEKIGIHIDTSGGEIHELLVHGYKKDVQCPMSLYKFTREQWQTRPLEDSLRKKLEELENTTYCAYCGERFALDDKAATFVTEHIRTCPDHPMRAIEAERNELLAALEALIIHPAIAGSSAHIRDLSRQMQISNPIELARSAITKAKGKGEK